jgi:hypothetical protein
MEKKKFGINWVGYCLLCEQKILQRYACSSQYREAGRAKEI